MPDLLLELLSEEIPARMQRRAAEDLGKLVTDALVGQGFVYDGARAFATPRRLALHVAGVPAKGPDVREERRGPRVGAPAGAIQGFLKSAGLASLEEARVVADPKKGEFYAAITERPGRPTPEVLAEILPGILKNFPWPKSMRWGAASREPGSLRWVRPLQSILCTFGPETEDPEVVRVEVGGIASSDTTRGHRFLGPGEIRVRRFDDYVAALERAFVVLDPERRKDIILHDARDLSFARGFELVEDDALLEEVAGLVEWPRVLTGTFDESFLAIPPEVIRATIRANQKCFVLRQPNRLQEGPNGAGALPFPLLGGAGLGGEIAERDLSVAGVTDPALAQSVAPLAIPDRPGRPPPTPNPSPQGGGEQVGAAQGALANVFILISNLEARDGGAAIVAGNERVVRARLSDARFFWESDLKIPLESRLEKLKSIVFHEKLGTQFERVERISALARELAPVVGADPDLAERAARLAKADLVTEMVGEFPELQGLMGRYYASAQGEHPSVAAAIEEHYKPLGPSDRVPTDPVSVAVALADKIDTLVGFWAIDEKPTGSKDPYALRRAALGVIRLVLERECKFGVASLVTQVLSDRVHDCWNHRGTVLAISNAKMVPTEDWDEGEVEAWRYQDSNAVPVLECMQVSDFIDLGSVGFDIASVAFLPWDAKGALDGSFLEDVVRQEIKGATAIWLTDPTKVPDDLLSFFADRLKVYLRDQGARHDLIDAVFAAGASSSPLAAEVGRPEAGSEGGQDEKAPVGAASSSPSPSGTSPTPSPSPRGGGERAGAPQDDLLMIVRRVEALGRFLDTEDGKNLLAGTKRAANILRIEEKRDGRPYDGAPDGALLKQPEEQALAGALEMARSEAADAVAQEDFEGAMRALSRLRAPVDAFFDKVTVNAENPALRENRLRLLNAIREATRTVADFSRIGG